MAFPTIPTVAAGRVLEAPQADTSATRTFPSLSGLTKNSGDLLIAIIVCYQSSLTSNIFSSWGAGFTEFLDVGSSASNREHCIGAAYKWSTGSETGTFSVTQAGTVTGHAAMFLLSIPGAHASTPPEAGTMVVGLGATIPDPGSLDPAGWGTEDTLWVYVRGDGETSTSGSWTGIGATPPTNYSGQVIGTQSADVVGGAQAGVAFRQLNASSEDPSTWGGDTSNTRHCAVLLAVRPAAALTNYALDAAPGSYALAGVSATPLAARLVSASAGSYALTGSASQGVRGFQLAADLGAYALTGGEPGGGGGAWEVDQASLGTITSEGSYGDQQITFTSDQDVAAGAWAILRAGWVFTSALSSVADDGPDLTWDIVEDNPGGGDTRIALVRAYAPDGIPAGTTWTLDWSSGDVGNKSVGGASFLGGDEDAFDTALTSANGSGTSWSIDYTAGEDGELVVVATAADSGAADTPDTGTVELFDANVLGSGLALLYKLADAGAGTLSGTWSFSDSWVAVGLQMVAAAAGSETTLIRDALIDASAGTYAITGAAAGLLADRDLDASPGTYTLTGADADLVYGAAAAAYVLDAQPGSFALTGIAATPLATRLLAGDAGTYALSGVSAGVAYGRALNAGAGSYVLSGVDAEFVYVLSYALDAQPGSYALSGIQAGALRDVSLGADAGAYAFDGEDATMLAERILAALEGTYDLTGASATLDYSLAPNVYDLDAGPASYAVTGTDAATLATRLMNAASGTYAMTGVAAGLKSTRGLSAEAGSYVLTGVDADLVFAVPALIMLTAIETGYLVPSSRRGIATSTRGSIAAGQSGTEIGAQ